MIRACVVDDEPVARAGVLARLAPHRDVEIVGEYEDGGTALAGMLASQPDLVFMDIQMPDTTGLDVLAAFPQGKRPLSILLTAHEGFAVRAFALGAIDYLLKPIDDDRFNESLDRAREMIHLRMLGAQGATVTDRSGQRPPRMENFSVRIGHKTIYVPVRDVDWISADGDYATLHVGAKIFLVRESLQTIAARLDEDAFVRVHRSSIVRIERISELQPLTNRDAVIRLADGTPLRASRTYMDGVLAKLRRRDILG